MIDITHLLRKHYTECLFFWEYQSIPIPPPIPSVTDILFIFKLTIHEEL